MTLTAVEPQAAERLIALGAKPIDIRDADEQARERIAGAARHPPARIEQLAAHSGPMIFHCRTGMRPQNNADRLAAAGGDSSCSVLAGGIDSWRSSGRPTIIDKRQVQFGRGRVGAGWQRYCATFPGIIRRRRPEFVMTAIEALLAALSGGLVGIVLGLVGGGGIIGSLSGGAASRLLAKNTATL